MDEIMMGVWYVQDGQAGRKHHIYVRLRLRVRVERRL